MAFTGNSSLQRSTRKGWLTILSRQSPANSEVSHVAQVLRRCWRAHEKGTYTHSDLNLIHPQVWRKPKMMLWIIRPLRQLHFLWLQDCLIIHTTSMLITQAQNQQDSLIKKWIVQEMKAQEKWRTRFYSYLYTLYLASYYQIFYMDDPMALPH